MSQALVLTETEVLAQVKDQTGCSDAQVTRKTTDSVWEVLTATPDSEGSIRTTYRFTRRLVDVTGPKIRILGF